MIGNVFTVISHKFWIILPKLMFGKIFFRKMLKYARLFRKMSINASGMYFTHKGRHFLKPVCLTFIYENSIAQFSLGPFVSTVVGIRKFKTIITNVLPFKEQYKVTHINSFTSSMVCKSLQACRYIIPVDFRAEMRRVSLIQVMKVKAQIKMQRDTGSIQASLCKAQGLLKTTYDFQRLLA